MMEICQICNKVGDHLNACDREDCPVGDSVRRTPGVIPAEGFDSHHPSLEGYTPRTDAALVVEGSTAAKSFGFVNAEFARQLERELRELAAAYATLKVYGPQRKPHQPEPAPDETPKWVVGPPPGRCPAHRRRTLFEFLFGWWLGCDTQCNHYMGHEQFEAIQPSLRWHESTDGRRW